MLQATRVVLFATVLSAFAPPAAPPSSVVGQITILERPGEPTEDLENAVVFLEPAGAAAARTGATKVVMTLEKRQFSPRVRVITTGSTVAFPNEDRFSHNVFSKTNGGFDTGVYGRGKTKDRTFDEPGVYSLYCNVHPRMTGFVIALGTPWFTQPGADGRFSLDNVPPGDYTLTAWHDRATAKSMSVTVTASGTAPMKIALDARGYRYVQHKNKFGKDYSSATGDRY